jgi:L-ascorbate metabolism protein UlaG (beta-lactamase superfamily)
MELQYFGGNCIKLTTKKASIVIDDNLAELGLKSVTKSDDITLHTNKKDELESDVKFAINRPGEYELSNVSITGIPARLHVDEKGVNDSVIYKIVVGDIRVVILGHLYPELNEKQLEEIGMVDIVILPVGGHGFTLDAKGAQKLVKDIDPKVVIPTNYADKAIKYPVEAADLETFFKELNVEPKETTPKLKLKNMDGYTEKPSYVVLERQ